MRFRELLLIGVLCAVLILQVAPGAEKELDPYSQFLTKTDVEQLEIDTEGEFGGLGIEITLDERRVLTVITPLEDTPAMKAGVLPGDRIVEIEGRSTYGITLLDAVQKLRGRPGSINSPVNARNSPSPATSSRSRACARPTWWTRKPKLATSA